MPSVLGRSSKGKTVEIYGLRHKCCRRYKNKDGVEIKCNNLASYKQNGRLLCGVHSTRGARVLLPRDPNRKGFLQQQYDAHDATAKAAAEKNRKLGKKGVVILRKIRMRKLTEGVVGFRRVAPNFRHQDVRWAYGCKSLSPKAMGPVKTGMKDYPDACNIENYHQGSKIFACELENGKITEAAKRMRKKMFLDEVPYRHKFQYPSFPQPNVMKGVKNRNIPEFSAFYSTDGKNTERRFNYQNCRYFYCHWYEKLARGNKDLLALRKMLDDGFNLQICGYDAHDMSGKTPLQWYTDTSVPFGHEAVLFCLLTIQDPHQYPWNVYYKQHEDLYKDYIPYTSGEPMFSAAK